MRVLPGGADHASDRAAEPEAQPDGSRHRHSDVGQHLPLRDVPARTGGHPSGCEGVGMNIENVTRRGFLKGAFAASAFVLGANYVPEMLWAKESSDASAVFQPDIFLGIASDGTITIVAHRSEMG